jgi:capsular polysaccharide biosynthesis protein
MNLYDGRMISGPAPQCSAEEDRLADEKDRVRHRAGTELAEHRNVVFAPGGEAFVEGKILAGYFPANDGARRLPDSWYESRHLQAARGAVAFAGDHVWITDRFSADYYHWIFDCLPRLEAFLTRRSHGRLLLPRGIWGLPFVRPSLAAYPQIELVDPPPPAKGGRVECLLVPDAAAGNRLDEFSGRVAMRLVGKFAKGIKPSASVKLHVSRILARKRKLANEPSLAATFARHGYKPVMMEQLDFGEQVRLAASASAIAGVHGAGLANSLFMRPGSAVVELRQIAHDQNRFRSLATARGHSYFHVPCKPANPHAPTHAGDVACEPGTLDEALASLQARRRLRVALAGQGTSGRSDPTAAKA